MVQKHQYLFRWSKETWLWRSVLDDQGGPIGRVHCVAAEELDVVSGEVIVVVLGEAQAELGGAGRIDEGDGGTAQGGRIDACDGCIQDLACEFQAGGSLEVSQLQGGQGGEEPTPDVN